jgi:hypothetical protein
MSQDHPLDALAALVEDRLDAADRERLTAHLAGCAECRATLAAMTRARAEGALPHLAPAPRAWPGRGLQVSLALAASVVLAFAWMRFATPPGPAEGDGADVRRGAERIVDGKTFRLEDGIWVDRASDDAGDLPTMVVQGAEQRAELLARLPQLEKYSDLGSRVIVVSEGTVYRFEP